MRGESCRPTRSNRAIPIGTWWPRAPGLGGRCGGGRDAQWSRLILLTGAAVVLAATMAVRLAHGIGLPGLLVFLGLGPALGEAGVGVRSTAPG